MKGVCNLDSNRPSTISLQLGVLSRAIERYFSRYISAAVRDRYERASSLWTSLSPKCQLHWRGSTTLRVLAVPTFSPKKHHFRFRQKSEFLSLSYHVHTLYWRRNMFAPSDWRVDLPRSNGAVKTRHQFPQTSLRSHQTVCKMLQSTTPAPCRHDTPLSQHSRHCCRGGRVSVRNVSSPS